MYRVDYQFMEQEQLATKFRNMSEEDFSTTSAYVLARK